MRDNMFETVYFGKPYKTRDGRKAIYLGYKDYYHIISPQDYNGIIVYKDDGLVCESEEQNLDIISEWKEEISEEELEDIAIDEGHELSRKYGYDNNLEHENIFIDGVKEGYHIAIEKYGSN